MYLTFTPSRSTLPHKLADGMLHFDDEHDAELFRHVILVGFEVWHQRDNPNILYVTFPQRQTLRRRDNAVVRYTLIRPAEEAPDPETRRATMQALRDSILAEYQRWVRHHEPSGDPERRQAGAR